MKKITVHLVLLLLLLLIHCTAAAAAAAVTDHNGVAVTQATHENTHEPMGIEGHDQHGNDSDDHEGHGVHLASLHFEYVREPLVITLFLFVVAICKLGFHHANFLSSSVPESCLLIVLGTVVGAILHVTGVDHQSFAHFNSKLFFLFLLPPIILESAYSLHDRVFFDNLGTVILYAVVGTIMNFLLIAPTLYLLARCGAMGTIRLSLMGCFVFGSLIVAVDPVAVLAIFQEVGVNNVLYFLVFGESLLNDAVTVVLYNMMKAFNQMDHIPPTQIILGIAAFFTISLGGLSIGIIFGIITSFFTKFTQTVRVVEPLTIFSLAFMSYLVAELFHFSGIISIIGCGLVQAQYAFHNISHKSNTTITYFTKMISATCDSVIFMFLGLALVRADHVWHTGFILWSAFLCLAFRFAVVYFLTFFANKLKRVRTIGYTEQFIMAYGGLRGAVAFCLVAMLDEKTLPNQKLFETTTLFIIIFTVFVQGISIKPLVRLLRITGSDKSPVSLYEEVNTHVTDHVMAGIEEILAQYGSNFLREKIEEIDNRYLKHWLQRNPQTKDDEIMALYQKMAMQMHIENVAGGYEMDSEMGSHLDLYKPVYLMDQADDEAQMRDIEHNPELLDRALDSVRRASHPAAPRKASMVSPALTPVPASPNVPKRRTSIFPFFKGSVDEDPEAGDAAGGRRRRKSIFNVMMGKSLDDGLVKEDPSVDDVRRWLVKNPTKDGFHKKYNKDLVNEEESDLLHHLHEKQRRLDRRRRTLVPGVSFASPSGSVEHIPGSPKTELERRIRARKARPPLSKSKTLCVDENERTPRMYTPNRPHKQRVPLGKQGRSATTVSEVDPLLYRGGSEDNDSPAFAPSSVRSSARSHSDARPPEHPREPTIPEFRAPAASAEPPPPTPPPESTPPPPAPATPPPPPLPTTSPPAREELSKQESQELPVPVPKVLVKSPSGTSISDKGRGHLSKQHQTILEDDSSL